MNRNHINQFLLLPLIFGVILIFSYLRGVNQFGFEKATASFRSSLYFYSTFIFTLVIVESKYIYNHLISSWITIAWILFFITILRWVLLAGGLINSTSSWIGISGLPIRVINASQTFFLLQAVVFAFIMKSVKSHRLIPLLFIPSIILLQHRTVWAVLLFLIGFVLMQRKRKNLLFVIVTVLLISLSAIIFILVSETSVALSLRQSALNFNTFYWRIEGWGQLLSPSRFNNFVDYFIGQPFGTGFTRYVTNSVGNLYIVTVSPHNFYLYTFLTTGAIGLALLMILYMRTIIKMLRNKSSRINFAFAIILITQLLFSITYRPSYEQGFMLGMAILLSAQGNDK